MGYGSGTVAQKSSLGKIMVISISAVLLGIAKIAFLVIFTMFWWFCCYYSDMPSSKTENVINTIMFVAGITTVIAFLIYTGEVVDFITSINFVA